MRRASGGIGGAGGSSARPGIRRLPVDIPATHPFLMDRARVKYLWGRGLQAEDGAQGRVDLDHADRGKLSGGGDEASAWGAEPRRIERPNLEA